MVLVRRRTADSVWPDSVERREAEGRAGSVIRYLRERVSVLQKLEINRTRSETIQYYQENRYLRRSVQQEDLLFFSNLNFCLLFLD